MIDMKRTGIVLMLCLSALTLCAQETNLKRTGSPECEAARIGMEAPYYYCDCHESSRTFAFPLEEEITDTVWYTATVDDLKQGISAYWFSDCSVTMEVYAMCTSKEPTISMTIGKNQMREIDVAKINQKISEMGETAQQLMGALTPHIRVYPNGGTGRVFCYPYNQGPSSSCDDPLPLRPAMTYVTNTQTNEYKLAYSSISSKGKAFILWKQEKSSACEIWLTLDSCDGQEIGRAKLTDSLHVYQPDSAALVNARSGHHDIWLHAKHAKNITGRLYYYNNPKYKEGIKTKKSSACQGKTLKVNMRTYSADTSFIDTLWVARDTLSLMKVQLTFKEPTLEYDTVRVFPTELSRGYRYTPSGDILYTYNDTIVEIVKKNTCTRRIQVTVLDPTGIEHSESERPRVYKQLRDGKMWIIVDERKYNALGQPVE